MAKEAKRSKTGQTQVKIQTKGRKTAPFTDNGQYSTGIYSINKCKFLLSNGNLIGFPFVLQDCRGTNGSTPDDGQLPLELILLVDDDDTENNNNNNRNLNNINNNNNTEGHTNNHKDKEGNDELTATKDNLKSFIERWEEHPNSPYVFDTDANRISPVCVNGVLPDAAVHPKRLNGGSANSGLSSRGKYNASTHIYIYIYRGLGLISLVDDMYELVKDILILYYLHN